MSTPDTALAAAPRGPGAAVGAQGTRTGVWLAGAAVLAFLLLFFVLPVARVFITAFLDGDGSLTFRNASTWEILGEPVKARTPS